MELNAYNKVLTATLFPIAFFVVGLLLSMLFLELVPEVGFWLYLFMSLAVIVLSILLFFVGQAWSKCPHCKAKNATLLFMFGWDREMGFWCNPSPICWLCDRDLRDL